jgi:hypothetical protein
VRRGLGELDHRVHTNADHLRVLAGHIEDAQSGYDHVLAAAGIATVAGIGLTLVTGGLSDVLSVEADSALAATVAGMIAQFELAVARMTALIAELADLMGALASRFTIEFAIKAPELASGAAGGAGVGVAFSLADGERDLRDLALSGALGGLVEGGRLGRTGARGERGSSLESSREQVEVASTDLVEQAWRESLSPSNLARQAEFDRKAAIMADPANVSRLDEPLTPEVAQAIRAKSAERVMYVGRVILDPLSSQGNALTDLDIETDRFVIQVKSGGTKGFSKQIDKSRTVTGKPVLGFAPEMSDIRLRWYEESGYTVFRGLKDLLAYIKANR